MKSARWIGLTLILLSVCTWAWGQATAEAPKLAPKAAAVRRDGNRVRINGKPTVLLWARGLTDAEDLEAYVAAGFNTLAVPITEASEEALTQAFELATAAEEQGLLVVGVLAPAKLTDEDGNEVAFDPVLEGYAGAVQSFVGKAVEGLGQHPRLVAWVVEVRPEAVVWGDPGFRKFLGSSYQNMEELNAQWGSNLAGLEQVSADGVRDLDGGRLGGVGRASVDFAYYRQKTYADALAPWTAALRQKDSKRLVFVGGITDYRSAIGLEQGLDGLVMETTPRVAEPEWATGNVHAVDIARRANRLAAVQTLDISADSSPTQVRNWINLALLHGASGVQFWPWSAVKGSEGLTATVKAAAEGIAASGDFPTRPKARAAVLYEPYAGGARPRGKSLYGYLEGLTDREPSNLFFTVRNGSRYGLMDVLSLDSLSQVNLQQYGAIIVPEAFYLPDDAQAALHQFALQGGLLVADAGAGMYQARGVVSSVPDILRETFGLAEEAPPPEPPETEASTPLAGMTRLPKATFGGDDLGRAQARVNVETLTRQMYLLLQMPDVSKALGIEYGGADSPAFRARRIGKGMAVYAPIFLYQQWDQTREDYAAFHDHLLGWRSDLWVTYPDQLWPPVEASCTSDGLVSLVTAGAAPTALRYYGDTNTLYQVPNGAVRVWAAAMKEPVELLFPGEAWATARPLPITLTPQGEGAAVTAVVVEYDAAKVELEIHGTGAVASPGGGAVLLRGGELTQMTIALTSGAFEITPGQSYHVVAVENGRTVTDYMVMPDPDSKVLTLNGRLRGGRLTITPAEAAG